MVMPLYDDNPFTAADQAGGDLVPDRAQPRVFLYEAGATPARARAHDRHLQPHAGRPRRRYAARADGSRPSLTLITYQFFHADIGHIVGNMLFLWVFGDDIERALGRLRFLVFYLLCGVVGGLVFVVIDPHIRSRADRRLGRDRGHRRRLSDAASLRQDHRAARRIIPLRISAYWVIGVFVLMQLWNLGASSKSEVAYWCHFGGMLAGAVLFPLMKPPADEAVRVHAAGAGYGGADRPNAGAVPPGTVRAAADAYVDPRGGAPLGCAPQRYWPATPGRARTLSSRERIP